MANERRGRRATAACRSRRLSLTIHRMAPVPEQSNDGATAVAAPPALIERASELVRAHPECFWFRHPEARIRHLEDIRLVVEHLR